MPDAPHDRGPLPAYARPLATAFAPVYAGVVHLRNNAFDQGRRVVTLDRPVISVGNLSVGGTGKTPMVARLVRALRDAGHDPAIAMRGYKAEQGLSDEAETYKGLFEDLPIVAQPNRTDGLIDMFATERGERVDTVVLDDGFQHRRLARQLDIVLIDATRSPFTDRVLPLGWLREPVSSLARAHAIVLTHAERATPQELATLRDHAAEASPNALVCTASHQWTGLLVSEAGGQRSEPVSWLRGRRVASACAIGNPAAFLAQLAQHTGTDTFPSAVLRDHDPMGPASVEKIRAIARDAQALVVTEKDWVKLRTRDLSGITCPIARPVLELALDTEALTDLVLTTARRGVPDAP